MFPHHFTLLTLLLLLFIHPLPPSRVVALNTVADCGPSLLPLAPCGPFMQGSSHAPALTCCENVYQLYKHNVTCLCILLDNSSLESPLPINVTLALQLPLLCKLNIDPSTCPGVSLPSTSPPTQVSFGSKPKSIFEGSASPTTTSLSKPRIVGYGSQRNAEVKMKAETQSLMLLTMAAIFFTQLT